MIFFKSLQCRCRGLILIFPENHAHMKRKRLSPSFTVRMHNSEWTMLNFTILFKVVFKFPVKQKLHSLLQLCFLEVSPFIRHCALGTLDTWNWISFLPGHQVHWFTQWSQEVIFSPCEHIRSVVSGPNRKINGALWATQYLSMNRYK